MNIALIQSRMKSKRFPGKAIKKILDKTITEWAVKGVKNTLEVDHYGIVMPDEPESKEISKLFENDRLCYKFFGSKEDLIDRYYKATLEIQKSKKIKVENIIRITGDCPLIGFFGELIDVMIKKHIKEKNDLTHNTWYEGSLVSGIDIEIMAFKTLEKIYKESTEKEDREHVTRYIINNPGKFKIGKLKANLGKWNHKWSIDDKESFERVDDIMKILKFIKSGLIWEDL